MNKNQDEQLLKISGLKWLPFVGESYNVNEKKVLLIGESHYYDPDGQNKSYERVDFTRLMVNEMAIDDLDYRSRFFAKVTKFFKDVERTALWNNTSFYNFIQRGMIKRENVAQGVAERPSSADFLEGWNVFFELVKSLKPDYCIFFGNTAANHFGKACKIFNVSHKPIVWQDNINRAYFKSAEVNFESLTTELVFIKHPSKHFSADEWRAVLNRKYPDIIKGIQNVAVLQD